MSAMYSLKMIIYRDFKRIRNLEPCLILATLITSYKLKQKKKKEFKYLYSDLKSGNGNVILSLNYFTLRAEITKIHVIIESKSCCISEYMNLQPD